MSFGALCFYGTAKTITHVGIALTSKTMLEAGGGGSTTTTEAAAAAQNAFIRLRPIHRRADLVAVIQPAAIRSLGAEDVAYMRDYMMRLLGLPYRWGGDDPINGFDCSGLALEVYTAFGLWPGGDATAHDLYRHFSSAAGSTKLPLEK